MKNQLALNFAFAVCSAIGVLVDIMPMVYICFALIGVNTIVTLAQDRMETRK